jgi:DNA-binding transcriptional MerR regulator
MEEARWTLDELAERVDAALAVGYDGQPSRRVRNVPDRRAIRWYTTIGLIDRPAAHRGRTALYGQRHLLQLVAIKRLQARGLPLVAIQQQLAGATNRHLAGVARLPEVSLTRPSPRPAGLAAAASDAASADVGVEAGAGAAEGAEAQEGAGAPEVAGAEAAGAEAAGPEAPAGAGIEAAGPVGAARRPGFWRERPSPVVAASPAPTDPGAPADSGASGPASARVAPGSAARASAPADAARWIEPDDPVPVPVPGVATLRGVRLGPGATLLLDTARDLAEADLRALLAAARPLLAVLRDRGLAGRIGGGASDGIGQSGGAAGGAGNPPAGHHPTNRPGPRREHP